MCVPTESRSQYVSCSLRRARGNALLRVIRGNHDLGILRKASGLLRNIGAESHAHVDEHEQAIQETKSMRLFQSVASELKLRYFKCGT